MAPPPARMRALHAEGAAALVARRSIGDASAEATANPATFRRAPRLGYAVTMSLGETARQPELGRAAACFADPEAARQAVAAFDLRQLPPAFYANPYPTYRALRELAPVRRMPDGSIFLSRHADCV